MNKAIRLQNRRKKYQGTAQKPRLAVYRSNKYIAAQIIDDATGKTLIGIVEDAKQKISGTKVDRAKSLGTALAEKAKKQNISTIIFDKGTYAYHGRVKAFAEGARAGGLIF